MAVHNDFGAFGEEIACRYLVHSGYRLLSRNWRFHHLEVDIVAEWYGEVIFVEVKSRKNEEFMLAQDAVDFEKRKHLLMAAKAYMSYFNLDQPYRFDIITVVGECAPYSVHHIKNAFTPDGVAQEKRDRSMGIHL